MSSRTTKTRKTKARTARRAGNNGASAAAATAPGARVSIELGAEEQTILRRLEADRAAHQRDAGALQEQILLLQQQQTQHCIAASQKREEMERLGKEAARRQGLDLEAVGGKWRVDAAAGRVVRVA